jgi:hypothetical protein
MNEFEPEPLENELLELKPAAIPEKLMSRLSRVDLNRQSNGRVIQRRRTPFLNFLFWMAPISAAAAAAIFLHIQQLNEHSTGAGGNNLKAGASPIKADKVEVVEQLVGTFDAVTHLPDGQPVRFRCSEWFDDVVLRDSTQGILIQHRVPRLEVKQVHFETY